MTKKDYELIAKVLANAKHKILEKKLNPKQTYFYLVGAFGASLEVTNPRFDLKKFFKACDLEDQN